MAKESSFKNMVITLLVITLISSALLGGVYELTKDAIAAVKIRKINNGISNVLPAFDNNPSENVHKKFIDGDTVYVYTATKDEKIVGSAVQTFTNTGYGGKIVMMVGFLTNGEINKIDVISHSETPGLGDKIEPKKTDFNVQFNGKNPKDYKLAIRKEGGDVDAMSGSTVSSKAFCDAVARAYKVFREDIMKDQGKWDDVSGATQQKK
ncbi:MAG: RnfABCDGE type electron transport complex subunit G [Prevotellaceae bacterium]|jgi:electron transport complex protein RnfG|nr:RnfABCDGE type electron transport complex subunit G [Prevotellaceae bacterium]